MEATRDPGLAEVFATLAARARRRRRAGSSTRRHAHSRGARPTLVAALDGVLMGALLQADGVRRRYVEAAFGCC